MSPHGEAESTPERRLRILAIDDEPAALGVINRSLGGVYDVSVAGGGEEGLRLALATRPDLILTDVGMPKMTGVDLLRRLREEPSLDDVPVVILAGDGDDAVRIELLRAGAQDFLVKPFSIEELRVRVANLLHLKQARELLQRELQTKERDIGALVAEVSSRRASLEATLATIEVARELAQAANRAKTSFLMLVSHELRSPLTAMGLTLEQWRRSATAGLSDAAGVRRMSTAFERLKIVVDEVIAYTDIHSGEVEPRPEVTDLAALMADLYLEFQRPAEAKGLRLDVEVAKEARNVTVDPRIVHLILSNLVGNAIKYSEEGVVQVRAHLAGDLILVVRDSGRGVGPADSGRIFEPFEHAEEIERKSSPGVGLGLTLVHDLVALLGGQIELTSEPGVGSTFTVRIPVSEATPPQANGR
jgi:signal transduction histidine kinase